MPWGTRQPRWVSRILGWSYVELIARIALTSAYWIGGIDKLIHFQSAVAEQQHFGLSPAAPFAMLTIAVELLGSACVISGRWVWLGAGALGGFTFLANLIANAFWTMQGDMRFAAMNAFFEHLGLIGGFVLVVIATQRQRQLSA